MLQCEGLKHLSTQSHCCEECMITGHIPSVMITDSLILLKSECLPEKQGTTRDSNVGVNLDLNNTR